MADNPKTKFVRVEMDARTFECLGQLYPAARDWAAKEGERVTGPGDVVSLAIQCLHEQVFSRAGQMLAEQAEAKGESLWPAKTMH